MNITPYLTGHKLGKPVLSPSGLPGHYDMLSVDCPFVFWHNGQWQMLHIGYDGIGYQTALAASDDLIHWQKTVPLFPRETLRGWERAGITGIWLLKEDDLACRPVLKKWQGKYWMVYHSYPEFGYEAGPACIGLAWTEDETLSHWERLPEPILSWENGNSWERGGLYKGSLVAHDGRFYLFYNAKEQDQWPWHEQIGLAVSDDMLHWTRASEAPLIRNTPDGWDSRFCADPCVVRDGDKWCMFYYGFDGTHAQEGIAISQDLLHWEKHDAPILHHGDAGSIDALHAHKPCIIKHDGVLYHFYCAVAPGKESQGEYRCITVAADRPVQ